MIDTPNDDTATTELPTPSPAILFGSCAWATVLGATSLAAGDDARSVLLLCAAWPPVIVLLGIALRNDPPAHWQRMAAGVVCFPLAATLDWVVRDQSWATARAWSVSDLVFALGYGLLASGIWSLVRRHGRTEVRAGLLDAAVMLIPPLVLLAEYVEHVPVDSVSQWSRLLAALYPIADLVLLATLIWLLAAPTLTRSHLGLLVAGMFGTLVADMALAFETLTPSVGLRQATEALFPLTYALLAAGIATGVATRPGRVGVTMVVHWGRVGLLGFGAILGPVVVVVAAMPPEPLPVLGVAVAVVATSAFIVWRMAQLARVLGVTTTQLARARRELEVQATHDPLTGLLNRVVLDDVLERLQQPDARPAALLSIDLDRFKAVNDTHGHAAGDAVLAATADRLRRSLRAEDLVLRVGGDEFLAALRRVGPDEARRLADRIVEAIEEPVAHGHDVVRISASVGVALLGRDLRDESVERSVARADAAMYAAKRGGPGSVHLLAEPGGELPADMAAATRTTVGPHDEPGDRPTTRSRDPQR